MRYIEGQGSFLHEENMSYAMEHSQSRACLSITFSDIQIFDGDLDPLVSKSVAESPLTENASLDAGSPAHRKINVQCWISSDYDEVAILTILAQINIIFLF